MVNRPTVSRRDWLGRCAGATAGTALLAGCSTGLSNSLTNDGDGDPSEGSTSEDWPMYGVDLANTGHHPTATGPEGENLQKRALYDLGGLTEYPVIVVDGVLYGHGYEHIYALDLETEEVLWTKEGSGPPTYHDGRIYGPTGEGQFFAFDPETGERWESEKTDIRSTNLFHSHMIPTDRGIYGLGSDAVWEFDPETGDVVQEIEIGYRRGVTNWPAYHENRLLFGRLDEFQAVNVETGILDWTFTTENKEGIRRSSPAAADGTVYMLSDEDKLHAIDIESGQEEWSVELERNPDSSPAVANGRVFVGIDGRMFALDAKSGDIIWDEESGSDTIWGNSLDIAICGGVCYAMFEYCLVAFDPQSGNPLWKFNNVEVEGRFLSPLAISDGKIYASAADESIYVVGDK